MTMVVNCVGYENGHRVAELSIDDVANWPRGPNRFIWIGLHEPSEVLLRKVQDAFGLHDLAIEDAHSAHQRPKLELYGNSLFIVLRTAARINGKIEFGETHIFAGRGYVVTVRHGSSISHTDVRKRCENNPDMLKHGEDFVVYSIMDFIVDNYFPIVHDVENEIQDIEKLVFQKVFSRKDIEYFYTIKSDLLSLRNMVSPVVDMCNRLIRFDVELIDEEARPYFRDIHDHVLRLDEKIDALRELLTSTLEANLLLSSVQQNEVMKKLAAWAAILAVPTAIAGVYGMNFDVMPELHWRYGYFITVGAIVGISTYLYTRFKKAGWL
jgi:magnesium transporter